MVKLELGESDREDLLNRIKKNIANREQRIPGGKLFGTKDLLPEEKGLYEEIISGGGETTPKHVRMFYPDKDKATLKIQNLDRKKKTRKSKTKRKSKKKGCGCT